MKYFSLHKAILCIICATGSATFVLASEDRTPLFLDSDGGERSDALQKSGLLGSESPIRSITKSSSPAATPSASASAAVDSAAEVTSASPVAVSAEPVAAGIASGSDPLAKAVLAAQEFERKFTPEVMRVFNASEEDAKRLVEHCIKFEYSGREAGFLVRYLRSKNIVDLKDRAAINPLIYDTIEIINLSREHEFDLDFAAELYALAPNKQDLKNEKTLVALTTHVLQAQEKQAQQLKDKASSEIANGAGMGSADSAAIPAAGVNSVNPSAAVLRIMRVLNWDEERAQRLENLVVNRLGFSEKRVDFLLGQLQGKADLKEVSDYRISLAISHTESVFESANFLGTTPERYVKVAQEASKRKIDYINMSKEEWHEFAQKVDPVVVQNNGSADSSSSASQYVTKFKDHLSRRWYFYAGGAVVAGLVAGALVYYFKVVKKEKKPARSVAS